VATGRRIEFITDAGETRVLKDMAGNVEMTLPRYAFWDDSERPGKPQIIECHDDLDHLKQKYGENLPIIGMWNEP